MTSPLKIRLYGDPCLRKESVIVKEVGPAERMLIKSMIETMHHHKGIGLAAPQVGTNQQIFVADIGDGPVVFVNPEILNNESEGVLEEGCLSIPDVTVNVARSEKILVKYMDENNKVCQQDFSDLLARVILHELDHLHGKLILDYATEDELLGLKSKLESIVEKSKS